ncbi:MAG TPA: hypothetical protein VLH79_10215 [Chthonomonadales bacterium]|nr:hypothetical protein [Chthonomonadales bacterium]
MPTISAALERGAEPSPSRGLLEAAGVGTPPRIRERPLQSLLIGQSANGLSNRLGIDALAAQLRFDPSRPDLAAHTAALRPLLSEARIVEQASTEQELDRAIDRLRPVAGISEAAPNLRFAAVPVRQ